MIISHCKEADRPFFESLFPSSKKKLWLDSCYDLNWKDFGFRRKSLGHLCRHLGVVNRNEHWAMSDAEALLQVLSKKHGRDSSFTRLLRPTLE